MRVVLGELLLVQSDDVRVLVEDDEAGRAVERREIRSIVASHRFRETHVVPQSREPTNSPCLRDVMVDDKREQ